MKKLLSLFFSLFLLLSLIGLNAQETQSGIEGNWVVSDSNLNYYYSGSPYPKKMANYKDSSILVAGLQISTSNRVFINRSTDLGESWQRIYEERVGTTIKDFYQIQHPTPAHIIAIAKKSIKDSAGFDKEIYFLMSSSDTANSWSVNDSIFGINTTPYSFNFNGKYGMVIVRSIDTSFLLYSNNYGDSWQSYNLPADLVNGIGKVLGENAILLAGKFIKKLGYISDIQTGQWKYTSIPDTFDNKRMSIYNKDTIWSASRVAYDSSNTSLRSFITGTTDGGDSWNTSLNVYEDSMSQQFGLSAIDFADKNYGGAVGSNVSYLTEDGGQSWENTGFYKRNIQEVPQCMFYYYNPVSKKRLLMTLLASKYVMKYKFEETTSLNKLQDIESKLKVYPNPVNDVLFIEVSSNLKLKNMDIEILSIDGMLVENLTPQNNTNNHFKISIEDLPSGTYILQLRSESYKGSKKIIKK